MYCHGCYYKGRKFSSSSSVPVSQFSQVLCGLGFRVRGISNFEIFSRKNVKYTFELTEEKEEKNL